MNLLFLEILSAHLPMLTSGTLVSPTQELADMGLDSLHTVSLLLDLEEAMDISLSDSVLADPQTFRTAENLWAAVSNAKTPSVV